MSDLSVFAYTPDSLGQDSLSGVYLLWHDVLLLAIEDLYRHPLDSESSHRWFLSSSTEIGSFLWICHTVGGSPEHLLRKYKRQLDAVLDPKFSRRFRTSTSH